MEPQSQRGTPSFGWEAAADTRSGWEQDFVPSQSQTLPRSLKKKKSRRRREAPLDVELFPSRCHTVSSRSDVPGSWQRALPQAGLGSPPRPRHATFQSPPPKPNSRDADTAAHGPDPAGAIQGIPALGSPGLA